MPTADAGGGYSFTLTYGEEVRKIEKPQPEGVKRLNINLPFSLHNQFKATTAARGEHMTDVLLEMIQEYVDKHNVVTPKKKGRR